MSASEFLLPEGVTLAAVARALAERLALGDGRWTRADRAYYDTFDGLLRRAGLVAVHEHGELALLDLERGGARAALPMSRPDRPLLAAEIEPGRLREQLGRLVGVRALLPVAEVHSRERWLAVLDGERETVARVGLVQPTVGGRRLRPRVRLQAARGHGKALRRVSRTLTGELGLPVADRPLLDEAVLAAGGVPGGVSARIAVPLDPAQPADGATVAVLLALLDVIEANLKGAIEGIDSEFLHDLRVSVRRSRAVQRELRRVFPPAALEPFRERFRWLQQVTGEVRDLDVYVLEFDAMRALLPVAMRPHLDPVLAVLDERRARARSRMVRALRSPRCAALLADWRAFLEGLETVAAAGPPAAGRSIAEVAGGRIAKVYARMVRMGAAIDDHSGPEPYHELRKQGKELRYLLELFGAPLFPAAVVGPMIGSLKALQDVLGRHQDRQVQIAMLRSLAAELPAAGGGAAAVSAAGALAERLAEDQRAARAAFARRFARFASARRRRAVRKAFA